MPRIPEAELERLKQDVSLLCLIESQGYEVEKRGKDWAMRCAFLNPCLNMPVSWRKRKRLP